MTDPTLTKGEQTRQVIAEAAYRLFIAQGFHGTSMRQIAEKAGVAPGGIYNHFASKEDLFNFLIFEKHPYKKILPILASAPGEKMEEFVHNAAHAITQEFGSRPEFIKFLFVEIIEFEGVHLPQLFQTIFPLIQPYLQRFSTPGGELRDIPAPVLMRAFLGMFLSYAVTEYMLGSIATPFFQGNILDRLVDIFLHGILKPETQ